MNLAYDYTAKNARGLLVSGLVFSGCYDDAVFQVRKALKLDPLKIRFSLLDTVVQWFHPRDPVRDRIRLYRTMAERTRIGRSLPQGLGEAVNFVEDKKFVSALYVMRESMLDGVKFADAMEKGGLPETDAQAVRAVQSAGKEGDILTNLAERMELLAAMKQHIAGIVWYPLVVLVAMWIVAWALTLFVAPKLGEFFERISSLQLALPAYAQAYYDFAAVFKNHALLGSFLWFALPLVALVWFRRLDLTALGDRIPSVHHLSMKADLMSIFSMLALLLGAGVKPVEALASVARAARREDNRQRLKDMANIYRAGNFSIARAVTQCEFPKYVQAEVSAGESANNTTQGMRNLVELLRQDLQRHMQQVQRLVVIWANIAVGIFLVGFLMITIFPQISATMSRL